jgi:hypothetical protein
MKNEKKVVVVPVFLRVCLALILLLACAGFENSHSSASPKGTRRTDYSGSAQNWALTRKLTLPPPLLETWEADALHGFKAGAVVQDADAGNGRSVFLKPHTTDTLQWDLALPRAGYYSIHVWARCQGDFSGLKNRAFLEAKIGAQTILLRVNFLDQHESIAHFNFVADEKGPRSVVLRVPDLSQIGLLIDKVELRDLFGNLARNAVKRKQVLWTSEEIQTLRKSAVVEAKPALSPEQRDKRDEELWSINPSPYLPVDSFGGYDPLVPAINPKTGKPAHWIMKDKVLDNASHGWPYSGGVSARDRFYVEDKNTGDVFPSNDYASGDLTSGDFADSGWGWDSRNSALQTVREQKFGVNAGDYFFVANSNCSAWRLLEKELVQSSDMYLKTGNADYGRDAAILFAQMAYLYPLIDFNMVSAQALTTDVRFSPYDSSVGGYVYSSWQSQAMTRMARAYDAIFPYLYPNAPQPVLDFLQKKLPSLHNGEDLRQLIETNLLQYPADQALRRHLRGAEGVWETAVATLATVQQDPKTTGPWLHELWTRAWMGNVNEGGLPDAITNEGLRDGCPNIGQPNYASHWQTLALIADLLNRYVQAGGDPKYDLSDPLRYPKVLAATTFPLQVRGAGGFQSDAGEGYTSPRDAIRPYPEKMDQPQQRAAYRIAFEKLGDARAAVMLTLLGRTTEPDELWSRIEKAAAPYGGNPFLFNATRALNGFGLIYLEAATQATNLAKKRALAMRTSVAFGHGHADALDIEMYAHGIRAVPDLGLRYTTPDTKASRLHNVVEVDGKDFVNGPSNASGTSWADHLQDAGWIRFAEAHSRAATLPQVKTFRRAVAMVDVDEYNSYAFDIFSVSGGKQHTWCFHGPLYKDFTINTPLSQATGPWQSYLKGYTNPQSGEAPDVLETDWTAQQGEDVHVRSRLFGVGKLPVATGDSTSFKDIKFLYVRRNSETDNLSSRWLQLIETYQSTPFIKATRDLSTPEVAALEIELMDGRRDIVFYDPSPGATRHLPGTPGAIEFSGRFGSVRFAADGALEKMYLLGGTLLRVKGRELRIPQAEQTAKILNVNYEQDRVWLDQPLKNASGRMAVIAAAPRTAAFDVAKLEMDGRAVTFTGTARVYGSPLEAVKGDTIQFALPLSQRRADPDYYDGMTLTNEAHDKFWHVRSTLDNKSVKLDAPAQDSDFTDSDGDGRREVFIYEFGPGETLRLASYASATREGGGYKVESDVDAKVTEQR